MTKRQKLAAAVTILGAIGASIWWVNRDTTGFAVLRSDISLQALKTIDIGRKPLFDLDLPLLGRIRYPVEPAYPFVQGGQSTGDYFIDPKRSGGVIYSSNPNPVRPGIFPLDGPQPYLSWTIGSESYEEFEAYSIWETKSYLECTSVFGSQPIIAHLETNALNPRAPFSADIRLPPNGERAPNLPTVSKSFNGWTVTMRPLAWPGPGLPIRYNILVDDGEDSSFMVASDWPPTLRFLPNPPKYRVLSTPSCMGVFKWPTQSQGDLIAAKHRFAMRLTRLEGTPCTFRAHPSVDVRRIDVPGGSGNLVEKSIPMEIVKFFGDDGQVMGTYGWYKASRRGAGGGGKGILAVTIDLDGKLYPLQSAPLESIKALKEGQRIPGTVFRAAEVRDIQFELQMPDLELYLGLAGG